MPLLLMRTLSRHAARRVVPAGGATGRSNTAAACGVPWGISESAYGAVDRHGTYQYKAFGVPGLGLKRGLGDELVVAPYATALGALVDPPAAAANLRASNAAGARGEFGFFESIDYVPPRRRGRSARRRRPRGRRRSIRAYMSHHQGMVLVALANVLLHDVMVRRFHADPRVKATELLLQERVPAVHADDHARASPRKCGCRRPSRRCRCGAIRTPHTAVAARAVPVQRRLRRRRHQRRRRQQQLARPGGHPWRGATPPPIRPARASTCATCGSGTVWSAAYHPPRRRTRRVSGHVHLRQGHLPPSRRRHHHPARRRRVARRRRRGAAHHPAPPRPRRPRDRRDQLRRDGARRSQRRPRPPGVRQALRRDRVLGEQHRAALPSAATRRQRRGCGRCTC